MSGLRPIDESPTPGDDATVELIRAARRQGRTSLDLSDRGLTVLPNELFEFEELEQLNLWDNDLTELPDAIGRLRRLTGLFLGGNRLNELPRTIGRLTALRALDLSGNRLTGLPPAIGRLTNLTTLEVGGNRLTRLPAGLARLTSLESVDLDGNPLGPELLDAAASGPAALRRALSSSGRASAPRPVSVRARRPAWLARVRRPPDEHALRSASFALVVVAAATLLIGLAGRGVTLIAVSILSSLVAAVLLVLAHRSA